MIGRDCIEVPAGRPYGRTRNDNDKAKSRRDGLKCAARNNFDAQTFTSHEAMNQETSVRSLVPHVHNAIVR